MRRTPRWVIAVWFGAFGLLVLDVVFSFYNIEEMARNEKKVIHSRDVARTIRSLLNSLINAETGQRGYLITGQDDYLDPYTIAMKVTPQHLQQLKELTADDPFHRSRMPEVTRLIDERYKVMSRGIQIRPNGPEAARQFMLEGAGQRVMDRIRVELAELEQHEEQVLAQKSSIARRHSLWTTSSAIIGGVLTVLMVASAFFLVRQELARRERAENEVRQVAEFLDQSRKSTAESLSLLDTFLSNVPIGIAFLDSDLRIVRINDNLAAANGMANSEQIGQAIAGAMPTLPIEVFEDFRRVLLDGRPILNREVRNRPGSPNRVWRSSFFPVLSATGQLIGVGEVSQDVTEHLSAQENLKRSEVRKAAILSTALDCVITMDSEGCVVEFNPAAERTFGYNQAEVLGQNMAELIVPLAHRAAHARRLAHFLATGEGPVLHRRIRLPGLRKDGTEFPAELSITPIAAEEGPLFTAYLRDITEELRAERTLQESERRFRILTEALPHMVWNADATGRVSYFNRRWTEFTGVVSAESVEHWWRKLTHPDDVNRVEAAWERTIADHNQPFEIEVRILDIRDGSYHWFLTAVVPLLREDGKLDQWIGVLSSIDDQKRRGELLTTLVKMRTAELETANHLLRDEIAERTRAESRAMSSALELGRSNEDLQKFAYVASHDLQEPLRKIQSFGDRLVKNCSDKLDANGLDYLDRMKSAATRMRTLIDDLLAFSQVTTKGDKFVQVDLSALVVDVLSDLEVRLTQTSGEVSLGQLPKIHADPLQMRQLFQNLIGNALKFHKPDTPPIIKIDLAEWTQIPGSADPPTQSGKGIRISVADNGIGFEQKYADRVFEVFQRLHSRSDYDGTGIGLAICRKIVQRHGGTIHVRSREGEGTEFLIDLPIMAAVEA